MKELIIIVCLFLSAIPLFAQPEEKVYRATLGSADTNSRVIFHKIMYYVFKKQDKKDLKGSFIEVSFQPGETDRRYRVGSFSEGDDYFLLEYNDSDINDTVMYSYNKHLSEDTIYIQWTDYYGKERRNFSVSVYDEHDRLDTIYESSGAKPCYVRIPREKYDFNKYGVHLTHMMSFDIPPCGINEIRIRATEKIFWQTYDEVYKHMSWKKNQLEELK